MLDCDTFEWTMLEPSGNPPDARGGHSAAIMGTNDMLMIFGGWSQISQYSNIILYDIEKNLW
jgi:dynein heavy chain